ncbi:hypothetical protein LINGRAHAP2_LOCUS19326 [Linum grandiflorum]
MSSNKRTISPFAVLLCLVVLMFAIGTSAEHCIGPCSKLAPLEDCDPLCQTERCNNRCQALFKATGTCDGTIGKPIDTYQCCCLT